MPADCPEPFRIPLADLPESWRSIDPLFVYGVSSQNDVIVGTDYAGPIPLNRMNIRPGISEWSLY
jgi:hypothetical protein